MYGTGGGRKLDIYRPAALPNAPITYVTRDDAPFLIIHGDADTTVLIEQSAALDAALKAVGVKSTSYTVVGGGHAQFGAETAKADQMA